MSFTYPEVGGVGGTTLPAGYRHLDVRRRLGTGDLRAVGEALVRWEVHRRMGVRVAADGDRAAPGALVTTHLGVGPLAVAAPCRVVGVEDSPDRVGFTYGTLRGHPFVGEESFTVERDADGVLWLAVRSFSRPAWRPLRPLGALVGVAQRVYTALLARAARRVAAEHGEGGTRRRSTGA